MNFFVVAKQFYSLLTQQFKSNLQLSSCFRSVPGTTPRCIALSRRFCLLVQQKRTFALLRQVQPSDFLPFSPQTLCFYSLFKANLMQLLKQNLTFDCSLCCLVTRPCAGTEGVASYGRLLPSQSYALWRDAGDVAIFCVIKWILFSWLLMAFLESKRGGVCVCISVCEFICVQLTLMRKGNLSVQCKIEILPLFNIDLPL